MPQAWHAPDEAGQVPFPVMKALSIEGAWVYTPQTFRDGRGTLTEMFRASEFAADLGYPLDLQQVNCTVSVRGVIRGIHFTAVPPGQAKYVFCPSGALLDVVVDIRVGSPTFGRWESVVLDETERRAVFLEHGLGHAFLALSDEATAVYLCSATYNRDNDHDINPLDPEVGIAWPADYEFILSAKDQAAPSLAEALASGVLPTYADCQRLSAELRAAP
jgi:dTDP-4-dehydrorhamnose 3,5-epimerase